MMKKLVLLILCLVMALTSCDDFLEPRPSIYLDTDEVWSHAYYGEGLLTRAYANLNTDIPIQMEFYTDNAVPRTKGANMLALGAWTVENNPIGSWERCYNNIKYLNIFLDNEKDMPYRVEDAVRDSITRVHRRGEAYFLRAWYQAMLLRDYGAIVDGEPLGYPIITHVLEGGDDLDLPRDSYEDCVKQIESDLNIAISLLPMEYKGNDLYTGYQNAGRASALAAKALKARVMLFAASPAYGDSSQDKWERAANTAYDAIMSSGGLTDLQPYGNFNDPQNSDFFWIQPTYIGNFIEFQNYPPSLYGDGNCNPSQNLVDAFPASDGYPIFESGVYDENHPYVNRDPRFERFIFFNGDKYNDTYIRIYEGGADSPGGLTTEGTRTGYYMKKHTSKNVRLTPSDVTNDIKFKIYLHKTELYLNFAEAANEAYGPTDASLGFSALDVMKKIRKRANPSLINDTYLSEQAVSKDKFRDFIQNERRIELSFEGFRFWDMRRLNKPLTHMVKGVKITLEESDEIQDRMNIALESTPSTDYVSPWENINAVNDGFDPTNSSDNSKGIYGNWDSAGLWRYLQYDFSSYLTGTTSNLYTIDQSDVYWFSDGGGILIPDSVYLEIWDVKQNQWIEIWHNWKGEKIDQWNTVMFNPVTTSKIKINFKSNTASCGIIEWKVWGVKAEPISFKYSYVDIEEHRYKEYMRYVPLPYSEVLKLNNLKQNEGW